MGISESLGESGLSDCGHGGRALESRALPSLTHARGRGEERRGLMVPELKPWHLRKLSVRLFQVFAD